MASIVTGNKFYYSPIKIIEQFPLMELPDSIRARIFEFTPLETGGALSFTCKTLKQEFEYVAAKRILMRLLKNLSSWKYFRRRADIRYDIRDIIIQPHIDSETKFKALLEAIVIGEEAVVKTILHSGNVDPAQDNYFALYQAATKRWPKIVKILKEACRHQQKETPKMEKVFVCRGKETLNFDAVLNSQKILEVQIPSGVSLPQDYTVFNSNGSRIDKNYTFAYPSNYVESKTESIFKASMKKYDEISKNCILNGFVMLFTAVLFTELNPFSQLDNSTFMTGRLFGLLAFTCAFLHIRNEQIHRTEMECAFLDDGGAPDHSIDFPAISPEIFVSICNFPSATSHDLRRLLSHEKMDVSTVDFADVRASNKNKFEVLMANPSVRRNLDWMGVHPYAIAPNEVRAAMLCSYLLDKISNFTAPIFGTAHLE